MRLLRDLWSTSPLRAAVVGLLIVLGAGGQAIASALAGPVLVDHSQVLFALLAAGSPPG
jgi:ATP-binding cassette, subfamily B, bacterial